MDVNYIGGEDTSKESKACAGTAEFNLEKHFKEATS